MTFKLGTDPDLAQQLVQNRVNQALPRLPDVTRQLGVTTVKSSPDLTMVVHLISPDGRYDMLYLRNYAVLNVKDQLAKIPGVTVLTPMDPALSAGIIAFEVEGQKAGETVEKLLERKVVASTSPYKDTKARLAPSLVNDEREVEAALRALREVV